MPLAGESTPQSQHIQLDHGTICAMHDPSPKAAQAHQGVCRTEILPVDARPPETPRGKPRPRIATGDGVANPMDGTSLGQGSSKHLDKTVQAWVQVGLSMTALRGN